jgi:hypothetical protein
MRLKIDHPSGTMPAAPTSSTYLRHVEENS